MLTKTAATARAPPSAENSATPHGRFVTTGAALAAAINAPISAG